MPRECGKCDVCCIAASVRALNKQRNNRCIYQKKEGGCGIYEKRPESCRIYRCAWLDGLGEEEERPDKIGLIVDNTTVIENTAVVKPTAPGNEDTLEGRAFIDRISKELGIPLIVVRYDQVMINRVVGKGL